MRLHWRRLRPGELDHELVWLCVSVASAGTAAVWLALHLPWPRCGFLAVTGLPCFTCGATRASLAFLQGQFATAWATNPLVFAGLCAVVAYDLYALVVLVSRAPRVRVEFTSRLAWRGVVALGIAAALVNWAYLLVRA
jgi:hypothetical protein